ncbi:MAG: AmmeMemoRadiSam system protein A [Spirochaeta sp.]
MHDRERIGDSITSSEAELLLQIAWAAVESAVITSPGGRIPPGFWETWEPMVRQEPRLLEWGASFATITDANDALRGCTGSLYALKPLWHDVAKNAAGSAVLDSRFPPVRREELPGLRLGLSLLGSAEELVYQDADELISRLRPGIDGVILTLRGRRATFLPQVWRQLPRPELFLSRLCQKAGLFSSAWRDEHPEISVYEVRSVGPVTRYAR